MEIEFFSGRTHGDFPLKVSFPMMFALSSKKGRSVRECWEEGEDGSSWNLGLRRNLNDWELDSMTSLLARIQAHSLGFSFGRGFQGVGVGEKRCLFGEILLHSHSHISTSALPSLH